ncbi:MAG: hypothetical protein IJ183_00420 [Prevotella sp.]|nr:hypothetical protein [Prevotella sp.]
MNYNHPNQVRSPRGYAKHIKPLYDGGEEGFSIAILEGCDGNHNVGIRWNVSEKEWYDKRKTEEGMLCVGMPQSRGYSVWFILPDTSWQFVPQMIKEEILKNYKQNMVKISEKQIQKEIDHIVEERFPNR